MTDKFEDEEQLITHEMNVAMEFCLFSAQTLSDAIDYQLSGTDMRVLIYYCLNCDRVKGKSHKIAIKRIADDLKIHEMTVYKSLAKLKDAGDKFLNSTETVAPVFDVAASRQAAEIAAYVLSQTDDDDLDGSSSKDDHLNEQKPKRKKKDGKKKSFADTTTGRVKEWEDALGRRPKGDEITFLRTFSERDFATILKETVESEKPDGASSS